MALFTNDPDRQREAMVAAMRLDRFVEAVVGFVEGLAKAKRK